MSASATTPGGATLKTWPQFLTAATALVGNPADRAIVTQLVEQKKYLLALQMIRDGAPPGDYQHLLNTEFNNPAVEPSELHKAIFELDARIVITTNFDKLYEKYCFKFATGEAFKVLPYTVTSLADELRSETRLIIKAHGSIDDINHMVFTRAEYHKAKAEHGRFYELLKALFLTNTVIFIGCGLNDPDVMLLLEDVKIVGQGQCTHYALTLQGAEDRPTVTDWLKSYNVACIEYTPDHASLLDDVRALGKLVLDARRLTSAPI